MEVVAAVEAARPVAMEACWSMATDDRIWAMGLPEEAAAAR